MYRYIIHGAGAVGSAIGGFLAKKGLDVVLVARRPHVEAVRRQNGLFLKTLASEQLQPIHVVESIAEVTTTSGTVIFQNMKANDTALSLKVLDTVDRNTPIVCWQNGIDNESIVSRMFGRVYGGVVRFTATMMTPGEVQFAGRGKLIVGAYPEGADDLCRQIAADLNGCGFEALVSGNIMQDKWLKLLVNLISCVKPMTRKSSGETEKRLDICRHLLDEGVKVLNAAGIVAASANGTEDSPEEMLGRFDAALQLAEGVGQGMDLKNSTWQSLAKHKKVLENDWYTGVIIRLGQEHGVPTPYNESVLHYLHVIAERELGPESVNAEEILQRAKAASH